MAEPMPELILDSVSQSYAKRQIIADLSFTRPEGAIGCLLGPSGCGKATVLRCVSGFEPIQARAIRIGGKVVSRPDRILPAEKRRIGIDHRAFRGTEFLCTLKLPSGQGALSLVPSHHRHAIGEKIGIRLAVDQIVAFRHG